MSYIQLLNININKGITLFFHLEKSVLAAQKLEYKSKKVYL